jgi:pimeloyl-ACP methyl ester carboxylesterase
MEKLSLQTSPGVFTQVWFANQGPKLAVFHHGVPKPRQLSADELAVFAKHGYSVACPVRQGYLDSTPLDPSPMAANASTTAEVAKQLGFESFVSFGFSGGGPSALADLALNPGATSAALFGSVAAPGLDFDYFNSFGPEEAEMFTNMLHQGMLIKPMFEEWAASSPELNVGAHGWICDEIAMVTPWGFDPSVITKKVLLFTSAADENVPASHTEWLHSKLSNSSVIDVPNTQHDDLVSPETIETALAGLV